MKSLLLILSQLAPALLFAHDTFFSFAEMQYDQSCECLEISLSISSHDLESKAESLMENYVSLEESLTIESNREIIAQFISDGFSIYQNKEQIELKLMGYELLEDGTCSIYLISESIKQENITMKYDLFMQEFSEQQNKLQYLKSPEKTETFTFFIFRRETEIEL
tara:strand:+ start:526 stop:1020 length:495 start_codon:yes stop_codon:yes gene_type:complete